MYLKNYQREKLLDCSLKMVWFSLEEHEILWSLGHLRFPLISFGLVQAGGQISIKFRDLVSACTTFRCHKLGASGENKDSKTLPRAQQWRRIILQSLHCLVC